MKKRKTIPLKYLPVKFPFWQTAFSAFLLFHYNFAGWIIAVWATLTVIWWIVVIAIKMEQYEDENLVNNQ